MIKTLLILTLSITAFGFMSQDCFADEYDNLAAAKAQAERQKQDQEQYAHELAEINTANREIVNRARTLAHEQGGTAQGLRCYEGLEFRNFGGEVASASEYTWQTLAGVPVGTRIVHYTTGNVIGAIAMSPFTIGAALHGSSDTTEEFHHDYPPEIGLCRFSVGRKYCSVTRYMSEDNSLETNCLK
jgi:hypothetical protein